MARIICAREDDKGLNRQTRLVFLTMYFVCGFAGVTIGGILSGVVERLLDHYSMSIVICCFSVSIGACVLAGHFFMKKSIDTRNHTVCRKCKGRMHPMVPQDTLFYIPAEGETKYDNPFLYLARSMVRIPAVRYIPNNRRGCFVCLYQCKYCGNSIVRIQDFLPVNGNCEVQGTYYFDLNEFDRARGIHDLI